MQHLRPSLPLTLYCSRKLGSVCSGVTLQRHTLAILWFLIIERKNRQNNFPGASLLSVQCTVHSVRASSAASVLFREVRQRVFCPPGQPWIHYFSLVLHPSFVFLWIQNFLVFCICVLYQIPASKDKQKIAGGKLKGRIGPKLFFMFSSSGIKRQVKDWWKQTAKKTGIGKTAAPSLGRCPNRREMEIYKNR